MHNFDDLWRYVVKRSACFPVVQERSELEHVFNLIKGCKSYLEIGTAEGNSLYVLSHALEPDSKIVCVDYGENHTQPFQEEIRQLLSDKHEVAMFHGDSTNPDTLPYSYKDKAIRGYDVVLIDGGHDFATVQSDCLMYAGLATKYVLFHDIKMPEVKQAVDWYLERYKTGKYYEFINSETMGYGIIIL